MKTTFVLLALAAFACLPAQAGACDAAVSAFSTCGSNAFAVRSCGVHSVNVVQAYPVQQQVFVQRQQVFVQRQVVVQQQKVFVQRQHGLVVRSFGSPFRSRGVSVRFGF